MYFLSGKGLFRQMGLARVDAPVLSEATGIKRTTIAQCLSGRATLMEERKVRRLAFYLDCEVEDLLDGKSTPGT